MRFEETVVQELHFADGQAGSQRSEAKPGPLRFQMPSPVLSRHCDLVKNGSCHESALGW